MERKNPYLKIAAVVSSVLLAGAFVSYRAGAFTRFTHPEIQPVPSEEQSPQMYMSPSKSAPAFTPDPNDKLLTGFVPSPLPPSSSGPQPPKGDQPPLLLMGGSKSKAVFGPATVTPANPTPPTYMGGSKYIVVAPNPADLSKPAPPEPPKP